MTDIIDKILDNTYIENQWSEDELPPHTKECIKINDLSFNEICSCEEKEND
tara:strand:+ start:448 stop:600 length:153 start_codon:yes stop_codon:yes gene_type:complete